MSTDNGLAAVVDAFSAYHRAADADDLEAARTALRSIRDAAAECGKRDAQLKRMTPGLAALTLLARVEARHLTRAALRIRDRVESLEQRMQTVEQKGVRYMGVHQRAQDYERGDIVTAKSSLWIALKATDHAPGDGTDWQLAVKGK